MFSRRTWDGLSKADQDMVKRLSREAQLEQRALWDAYSAEAAAVFDDAAAAQDVLTMIATQEGLLSASVSRRNR